MVKRDAGINPTRQLSLLAFDTRRFRFKGELEERTE